MSVSMSRRLMSACLVALFGWSLWGYPMLANAALPIEHWVHANGARVYLVQTAALPMLDVQVDVDGGARRDPRSQAGLASATALMLDKGVSDWGDRPALDENALSEAWADLGAVFAAHASADRLSFSLRTLTQPEVLDRAVALAAHQLAVPSFPAPVWERERERLTAEFRDAETQPATHAERAFSQAVYGSHPYGYQADPETWAAIDAPAMRTFYQRHARLCDARVTLVGAVDRSRADAVVDKLLAGWRANGCAELPPLPEVSPLQVSQRIDIPFKAAQAQVFVGQPGIASTDPDFLALTVGNHILGGGGFVSRLTREIREKRGLTYGVYSHFTPGRHAGAFTVAMQTRPDQAEQAVALIHGELMRFVQDGPTAEELAAAQTSLINGFALRLDSNRKLLGNVAALAWNDRPLDYLEHWPERVAAITREQVHAAFRRVLQPEKLVTVVVGGTP